MIVAFSIDYSEVTSVIDSPKCDVNNGCQNKTDCEEFEVIETGSNDVSNDGDIIGNIFL